MDTKKNRLDLESVRARLSKTEGKEYWRCLDELAATEEFEDMLHREFPREASVWNNPLGRRNFMKLMGASLAFAGLNGCGIHEPKETIVPYVQQPEEIVLGKPLYFATAMTQDGVATGLLAESHEGRPTKIEGNPQHPGSLGSTDLFCQASVLSLYDPDRSQSVTYLEDIRTWSSFVGALQGAMAAQLGRQGAGLRILTQTITSPSLADQINSLLAAYPQAKWYQYDPAALHNTKAGATLAFGQYVNTVHQFDKADVVLSLDSDFLFTGPGMVRYVRDFTSRRRLLNGSSKMNRLYVVESTPSNTGAMSDHRLPLRATEIGRFAASIAAALGVGEPAAAPAAHDDWINAIANDLKSHRGSGIVIAGESQPPYVHALVHAMNQSLGNAGAALVYTDPLEARPVDQVASLRELVADMNSGKVDLLLIVGGNPVYNAPADLDFAGALTKVPLRAHMGMYLDETS
ncbi:MAG TPA: TAT-variant-translocated molybdopterin oxidoreductase, partial [Blastocatellia bacterium]|nr:TAT-variant-translocated molybdopterin oxidoreductase [Blastocatellia bacterium]